MAAKRVLIVGGGIGGLTLAAALGRRGIKAEIVEVKPENTVYGVGIIQPGNALRALKTIGVFDDCLAAGFATDEYRYFDGPGHELGRLQLLRMADRDRPAVNSLPRPALHAILTDAAERAGARLRLGVTINKFNEMSDGVEVDLSDGTQDKFDMVVGADGIRSAVRRLLFGEQDKPRFTGHGVWRFTTKRLPELTYHAMYMGVGVKAGLIPLTEETMYLLLVTNEPGNPRKSKADLKSMLAARLSSFGGMVQEVRAMLPEGDEVIYVPIEEVILLPPWSRGRVALIGDAAHASGPHIAQGAAMAIEDAVVLAEMAEDDRPVPEMLRAFAERRYPRCKFVQDISRVMGQEGNLEDPEACAQRNARIKADFSEPKPRPHELRLAEPV